MGRKKSNRPKPKRQTRPRGQKKSLRSKSPRKAPRDKYGRFISKDPAKRRPLIPPQRTKSGKYRKGTVKVRKDVPASIARDYIKLLEQSMNLNQERFLRDDIKKAVAFLTIKEQTQERIALEQELLAEAQLRLDQRREVIEDAREGRLHEWSREELIDLFGDEYELDPHEWFEVVVYEEGAI